MKIKEVRCAFLQTETLISPLAALHPPAIPFDFLLNQGLYQSEIANAKSGTSQHQLPWHDQFGKLFWYFYLEKKGASYVLPKLAWQGLVPLQSDTTATLSASWLTGTLDLRHYIYPWGIAAFVDVRQQGDWSLEQLVDFGFKVRQTGKYDWTSNGVTTSVSMNGVLDRAIADLRARAYGAGITPGQIGESFSVVTVLDAEGASPIEPVPDQQELHRTAEAMTTWSGVWKTAKLPKIADHTIELKQKVASAGHLLYGNRRGRFVWFPSGFTTLDPPRPLGLACYHQNLLVSSLQAESLCCYTQGVAQQLDAGATKGQFPVTHGNCARLAAGILGRLHSGSLKTYRSHSVRDQIQRTFVSDVNTVRKEHGMPAL